MYRIPINVALFAFSLAWSVAPPAAAHEFWLEPADYTPKTGTNVPIAIRVGMDFKGNSYPFVHDEFKRFVVIDRRSEKPVKGVDGDDPALAMKFSSPGLVVFAHYSTPEVTVFDDWAKFQLYLQVEGLEQNEPLHLQAGKPMVAIRESYSRCAKLLLGVGDGAGQDRLTGMPLELVAERNPYRLPDGEPLPVRLYYEGKPIKDVQITAFSKADPENKQKVRTDSEGRAKIALNNKGPWLLNAVHLMEPARGENVHWTSLWASMTFARP